MVAVGVSGQTYSQAVSVAVPVASSVLASASDPRLVEVVAVNASGVALDIVNGSQLQNGAANMSVNEAATVVTRVVDAQALSATSTTAVTTTKPILMPTGVNVTPPAVVTMQSSSAQASIPASTTITDSAGNAYTGVIHEPTVVNNPPAATGIVGNAIFIGTAGTSLHFDKPVALTLDIPANTAADAQVYYYDTTAKSWQLAGDGGHMANGKMVVNVSHFTLYAVRSASLAATQQAAQTTPAAASTGTQFSDVSQSDWFATYVTTLVTKGVVKGYTDGTFRPGNSVNRAEVAKMLAITFGKTNMTGTDMPFSDVPADSWFAPFVRGLKDAGITGYDDGTYGPDRAVNRAEALVMIAKVAGVDLSAVDTSTLTFDDIDTSAWYAPALAWAYNSGIVQGRSATEFAPDGEINRAEISKMVVKAMTALKK